MDEAAALSKPGIHGDNAGTAVHLRGSTRHMAPPNDPTKRDSRFDSRFGLDDDQAGWMPTLPSRLVDNLGDSKPPQAQDPGAQFRRTPQERTVVPLALEWMALLPPRYRPLATADAHPHIVNKLAVLWDRPAELDRYFDELLLSNRPGRKGFAFDVLNELTDLRSLRDWAGRHNGGR